MLESQEMRKVYCDTMIALAKEDPRIVDVEADLTGAHGMKPFKAAYPDRSFNVGIAEANMVGVAAGLSACGKIPFVHSFATFASRRCFDQIAISVCYAGLNVKIVGSDPGVGAELNGGTHMALEDMGIMRTLPGMTVFEPTDSVQLRKALPAIVEHEGPVYIRLFRRQAENVFDDDYEFDLGKADLLRDGSDVTLIASGVCVANALQAAETLAQEGVSARVLNIHTIKPMDADARHQGRLRNRRAGYGGKPQRHRRARQRRCGSAGGAAAHAAGTCRRQGSFRSGGQSPLSDGRVRHHRRGYRQGGPQGHRQKVAAPGVPPEPSRFTGFTVSLPARPGGLKSYLFSDSSKDWIWIP